VTRVAAFDCGTNSLRLLIADVDPVRATLVDVDRRMEIVRLGQGVDATGRIEPVAMQRAFAVIADYAGRCRAAGVERTRFVATSATREAANRSEFVAGVQAALAVVPEVIGGDQEARLSFIGATRQLAAGHSEPYLVVDIGGGSTEVVLGGEQVRAATSVDVGCVRLTERYLRHDPPTAAEIDAAGQDVAGALDRVAGVIDLARARTLVGLAGSVTTVTAHALGLQRYDRCVLDGAVVGIDRHRRACADLLGATRQQRASLPYMHPGRVDVIGAGALIWSLLVARVASAAGLDRALTSEHDILDGIAWSLV
jgi:exopolyphosphatase/guanosine-5'-triphosphate,3'-diphosphate pyrophosphatase